MDLTMTALDTVALAGLHLKDADFVAFLCLHYLCLDRCALDERTANLGIFAIRREEDVLQLHCRACLAFDLFSRDRVTDGYAMLLTADADDCKCSHDNDIRYL